MTTPYKEYGLELPNGEVHWGQYLNRPLATEGERAVLALVLHKTAQECGFPEDEFVKRYSWVLRTVTPHTKKWAIDDPEVAPPFNQQEPQLAAPAKPASRRRSKAASN